MQFPNEHKQTLPLAQPMIPLPENRREALRLWLIANKITLMELGQILGISGSAV